MKKLLPGLILLLCLVKLAAGSPAHANDVLKFRVTTLTPRAYCYWQFSNASRTIQAGDCLEYDVYLNSNAPGVGGVEVYNTDGSYWRDYAGWADQNAVSGHPGADIASRAYGRWYHRRLPVPSAAIGKTTSRWEVAVDGGNCGVWECYSAVYDNVRITNGGSTVLEVYTDGAPPVNRQHFVLGGSIQSAHLLAEPTRKPGTQVGVHFFYWYNAPDLNADPTQMVFDPRGLSNTAPWIGYGFGNGYSGYYSTLNTAWWEAAFQDVKAAGADIVDLICWGNHPWPHFQFSVLSNYMVPALERSGVGIKIVLFDDTTSEVCEWNTDNGRGYTGSPPMPLSDTANWAYFYDRKIKPFYKAIPQKHWATHNNLPTEQGGRPIVYTYTSAWFADVATHGAALWQYVKTSFANDFKDANGVGITPFIIHEQSWINSGAGSTGDGAYSWGAAVSGPRLRELGGYWTSTMGAGYDDRIIRSPGTYTDRQRQQTMVGWYNGSYGGRRVWDASILTFETWNEFWEGSGIDRCVDYPDPWAPGAYLPETFYMNTFRNLVRSSIGIRDNDATFLRTWEIPGSTSYMSDGIAVTVRNDGMLAWEPGIHSLGGRLLNSTTGEPVPGTEGPLAAVPREVLSGSECRITFNVPTDWPTGSYILQLDIMQGDTWFASLGDLPVTKPLNLTRPRPLVYDDGFYSTSATSLRATWSWPDSQTTIAAYQYAIGASPSDPGSGYVVGWTNAGTAKSVTVTGLTLADGVTYYFYVRAQNARGAWSDVGASNGIRVDSTPPDTPVVIDDGAYTTSTNTLHASWTASDPQSGVNSYRCAIGTSPTDPGSGYIVNWVTVGTTTSMTRYGLSLVSGTSYYFYIQAQNRAGLWSPSGVSNGIMAVRPCSRISEVRVLPVGSGFVLPEKLVASAMDGLVFVEEPDRSCAIKLNWSGAPVSLATKAVVAGRYLGTLAGEPTADAVAVDPGSTGAAMPLGIRSSSVGSTPPDTRGLLLKIWGRVTYSSDEFCVLDDGSGVSDWLSTTGAIGMKVSLPPGTAQPLLGRCVSVAGISRVAADGRRWVVPRTPGDIRVW